MTGNSIRLAQDELEGLWHDQPQRRALGDVATWLCSRLPRFRALGAPTDDLRRIQIALEAVRKRLTASTEIELVAVRVKVGTGSTVFRLNGRAAQWSTVSQGVKKKQGLHYFPETADLEELLQDWWELLEAVALKHGCTPVETQYLDAEQLLRELSRAARGRGKQPSDKALFNRMLVAAAVQLGFEPVVPRESFLLQAAVGLGNAATEFKGKHGAASRKANRRSLRQRQPKLKT